MYFIYTIRPRYQWGSNFFVSFENESSCVLCFAIDGLFFRTCVCVFISTEKYLIGLGFAVCHFHRS